MAKRGITRGLNELTRTDDHFSQLVMDRRRFLRTSSALAAFATADIVFQPFMPTGLVPIALAESLEDFEIPGKDGLRVLNDRPLNAETPAHLLDDAVTPANRLFVRNNGIPPVVVDPGQWRLTIDGESAASQVTFNIRELKQKFKSVDLQITLECGGNGRAEFDPPASGNQWSTGAVGCPTWQGVRLRDVLKEAGIKEDAVYVAFYGADTHLSGDPGKRPISRGVPIAKALEDEAMIAWGMNGGEIPGTHGHPLRLVFGGWPGSTCGKWLNRIVIRNQVHDGPKMTGSSYRVPRYPVAPGSQVPAEDLVIIEAMPVKSLVTYPQSGARHQLAEPLQIRGHAWAGDRRIKAVHTSIDFGQTWQRVKLARPANRHAWQQWQGQVSFPKAGYYEVWAKATDNQGVSQPMVVPGWNPKGYLNNACHRVAVYVA